MNKLQTHPRPSIISPHPSFFILFIPQVFYISPIKCFIIFQTGPMLSFPPANIYSSNTVSPKRSLLFSQSELDIILALGACSYGMYHIYLSYTDLFSGLISLTEQKVP